jgi:hypothetical protein
MNAIKGRKGFVTKPLQERLDAKINKTDGCWLWSGSCTGGAFGGYGIISYNGKKTLVHRLMYEMHVNPIPVGFEVDHLCRNKLCVNPLHLEAVTHKENMLRANAGWACKEKTHCPHGHEYTPENTRITHGSRSCKQCESAYNKRRWANYREQKARAAIQKVEGK